MRKKYLEGKNSDTALQMTILMINRAKYSG